MINFSLNILWLEWTKNGKDYSSRKEYGSIEELEDEYYYYKEELKRLYRENKIQYFRIITQ